MSDQAVLHAPVPSANGRSRVAHLTGIRKTYFKPDGEVLVHALDGIDMSIAAGEYLAVMGASGSGKSTLMNILGCLDQPTGGSYLLDGHDVAAMDDDELSRIRREKIGFVFQAFNLISELSAVENVEVPLFYQGVPRHERYERAMKQVEQVGLGDRATHRPSELSGGEQQRVAIARALVNDPAVIMADEPTGNLDSKTGAAILELLSGLHDSGMTIIVVTHDDRIADRCQRIVRLTDGRIESDTVNRPRR
ncbi:MAG: ABC transporter ATP-binding protein [Planctomycetes bacterium]|nr:ABC transporter ATP-binding protein [Planctomycetota bacterium]